MYGKWTGKGDSDRLLNMTCAIISVTRDVADADTNENRISQVLNSFPPRRWRVVQMFQTDKLRTKSRDLKLCTTLLETDTVLLGDHSRSVCRGRLSIPCTENNGKKLISVAAKSVTG